MKKEDIIKKLENIELPAIENRGHKESLKKALTDWKYGAGRKEPWVAMPFGLKLVFSLSAATLLLVCVFTFNILEAPKYSMAEAEQIALKDPDVKGLIQEGGKIQDIKIIGEKAYVLVVTAEAQQESASPGLLSAPFAASQTAPQADGGSFLAEISFRDKKITSLQNAIPQPSPLTGAQKEKAREILKNSAEPLADIKEIIPVAGPASSLQIVPKNGGVEVFSNGQKARIIYETGGEEKEAEIDLDWK